MMQVRIEGKKRRILSALGIYAFVIACSLFLYAFGLLDSWQEKLIDRFYTRHQPQQSIVILAIDDESLNRIGQWPWPREVFAKALRNVSGATAIGIDVSFSEPSRLGAADDRSLADALRNTASTTEVVLPLQLAPRGKVSAEPLPLFAVHAGTGFVNLPVDQDAIVRRAEVSRDGHPSFSSLLTSAVSTSSVTNAPSEFRIRYSGPQGTFLTIPLIDLLEGRVPARVLEGAVVLIGVTANDLHDIVDTPFGPMPGVEAHANTIETILDGSYPRAMPPTAAVPLLLLASLLALLLTLRTERMRRLLPSLAALAVALNLLGLALFSYGVIYPVLYLNLSLLATVILALAFQYASESREKRFIKKTFQYYLMPEVVNELIEHPEKLTLGSERKDMTVLFSDIRDFTTISERLSPQDLTRVMNEYLTAMTEVIMENRGLVDKYIGDAVMAFWGAPLENQSQAEDACRVATLMSKRLGELNVLWKQAGLPTLSIRIGIATGSVVVGNMGSSKRFNYTVMGDEVNFASRLEGLNKAYGTECIVSEATRNLNESSGFLFRELDTVRVKGKKEARKLFELVTQVPAAAQERVFTLYASGRAAYARGDWDASIASFNEALAIGEDGPSRELLKRALEFKQHPPEGWDGVYEFRNK